MREHPIPQDITGYRFHIIGNMTLKQFGELALGVILAFITYATNLPTIIKVPFIVIFVLLGVIAAFIPIGERPLDHWLVTFFRVLYRPTLYFWQKKEHIPQAFTYTSTQTVVLEPELDLSPARRQRIKEYISSVSYALPSITDLDTDESSRLQSILQSFDSVTVSSSTAQPALEKPSLDIRVRSMRLSDDVLADLPRNAVSAQLEDQLPAPTVALDVTNPTKPADIHKQVLDSSQVAQKIEIPEVETLHVDSTVLMDESVALQQAHNLEDHRAYSQYQPAVEPNSTSTTATQFNSNLPFPKMPTVPNKPVGMVLSTTNDLITGAIIEFKTESGAIARAVKTNALGQFFITTPLESGTYVIETEKPGYTFTPQTLTLTNQVVIPIEIRGTPTN